MSTKNNCTKKLEGCVKLVNMKKKKITSKEINTVAKELGISTGVLENGWKNFQETGGKLVDRRSTSGKGGIKMNRKETCTCSSRGVNPDTAGMIIREYMTTDIRPHALCNKHRISVQQFYGWISELNVNGTLLGKKVLDPKKYAKVEIKDVIYMRKRPSTQRKSIVNLSDMERLAYDRVADILMMYMPKKKEA